MNGHLPLWVRGHLFSRDLQTKNLEVDHDRNCLKAARSNAVRNECPHCFPPMTGVPDRRLRKVDSVLIGGSPGQHQPLLLASRH